MLEVIEAVIGKQIINSLNNKVCVVNYAVTTQTAIQNLKVKFLHW